MDIEALNLFLIVLFSAIGFGYFLYGKKQREGMYWIAGVLLMLYPYLVSSALALVIVGLLLMASPFIVKRIGL